MAQRGRRQRRSVGRARVRGGFRSSGFKRGAVQAWLFRRRERAARVKLARASA